MLSDLEELGELQVLEVVATAVSPCPSPYAKTAVVAAAVTPGRGGITTGNFRVEMRWAR